MKKSIISLIIVCCLVFALGVISTQAATYTGSCGTNVKYTLDTSTGVLTISGTGAMEDYSSSNAPWYSNKYSIKSVIISDGVTSIGDYAFYRCSGLTSITIPDSVTSIGSYAFYGCSSLTSITIPDSVTSIGDYALAGCWSVTSITIPDSVTSIGNNAFYECSGLTSITIPDSVTSIGDNAFKGCKKLISVTIPDSVTSISNSAFGGCSSLTEIILPDSVTRIGFFAFSDCSSLKEITIPKAVTSIGSGLFSGCSSLTSINADVGTGYFVSVDGVLYNKSKTSLVGYPANKEGATYTVLEGVKQISRFAFDGCSRLTEITIPDSVTSIGDYAFSGCSSLTDVYYEGSEAEWNNITISFGNEVLENTEIHYNAEQEDNELRIDAQLNGNILSITPVNADGGCIIGALAMIDGIAYAYNREYSGEGIVTFKIAGTPQLVKVFAWKSFESMEPLCGAVTVK